MVDHQISIIDNSTYIPNLIYDQTKRNETKIHATVDRFKCILLNWTCTMHTVNEKDLYH